MLHNLFILEQGWHRRSSFPVIKDQAQFSVSHARSSKSNPIARWHICQGAINGASFSADGTYMATVGRDVCSRIMCGIASLIGVRIIHSVLHVQVTYVYSTIQKSSLYVVGKVIMVLCCVALGVGGCQVSGVAFDSYWSPPSSDGSTENNVYRFGSVGQDTQMLLWDLAMDDIVVPLRRCPPGGSPTYSTGSQSSHWDNISPLGTLQPAPSMRDVPKLSPLVAHRVDNEPLSGMIFTQESVLTACREGHVKIWTRPGYGETQPSTSESVIPTISRDKPPSSAKVGSSGYKQVLIGL
ncbi:hypothetical protein GIB67_041752 [Kingdonia uniflora]|uniref:Uncharacterized protein n=1 Tax=Kingdonia uniflora TaxID=39325 RepID=A0A7J7P2U5_9MAGN|nr:hypothetical protein GIB67_041752 [Kingdonia uniflora]